MSPAPFFWAATSTQDFGTGTGTKTDQTGVNSFIPNPTSGTTWARAGAATPNAPIVLATTSNPLGTTGAYLRAVASSSTSVSKASPWVGYTGGTEFYTSFKVLFGDASAGTTATSGSWTFYQGTGANFSDNVAVTSAQTFTGLRFTYGASGVVALTYMNSAGTFVTTSLISTSFTQGAVHTIEVVGNNKASGTIAYTYNGASQTVAVQRQDLYIDGVLRGDDVSAGALPANTAVDSGTFTGISSTSNVANIFVDDVDVYNAVPAGIGTPAPPSTQKLFQVASMYVGQQTLMTISVNNPNSATALTGVSWSDTLPTGLSYNGDSGPDPVCGGTLIKSGNVMTLTGATIAPLDTCGISVAAIANGSATGLITNTTSVVTSTNGGAGNSASADITVNPILKYRSVATGNWNSNATWETSPDGTTWSAATSTPTAATADTITIQNSHTVTVTASVDADQMSIPSGGTLTVNNGVTFTVADGTGTDLNSSGTIRTAGQITNNGLVIIHGTLQIDEGGFPGGGTGSYQYNQTVGVLVFNNSSGAYGVNNNNYWPTTNGPQNVTVQNTGGIQMNVARTVGILFQYAAGVSGANNLTLNGTSQINTGGFTSGSPTYGSSSLLKYNTGGSYARAGEWLATTSNPGYPNNVQISNSTTLDIANGVTFNSAASQIAGNLTVDSSSALSMGAITQPLTILGSYTNGGTTTLSSVPGVGFFVGGNWDNTNGSFTPNGRATTFNGSGAVTITTGGTSAGKTFNTLVFNKGSGGTATLAGNLSAGLLQIASGTLDTSGSNYGVTATGSNGFIISGTLKANSSLLNNAGNWTQSGTFTANTSTVIFNGANNTQTLTGSTTFNNLTINHTGTGGVTAAGSTLNVTGATNILSGTFTSATQYVDVSIDSGGELALSGPIDVRGNWTNNGTFTPNGFSVSLNGTGAQTITTGGTGPGKIFAAFTVNKGSGTATLAGNLSTTGLTVTAGTFDQGASFNVTSGAASVAASGIWTNTGTGDLTLSGGVSNAGTITFNANGTGCPDADDIVIASTGGQQAWSGIGTFNLTDVAVSNQGGTAPIIVHSGTDSGGNGLNWVFFAACTGGAYTWVGGTLGSPTDWTVGTNWTPTRAIADPGDVLTFNNGFTPIVTNIPTQTISKLQIINSTQPQFSAGGNNTLTIDAGVGNTGLDVFGLSVSGSNTLTIKLGSGTLGTVSNAMSFADGGHRLIGQASGAITFVSTGLFSTQSGFTGNAFGDGSNAANGAPGSIIFSSDSVYIHSAGASPFGASGNPSVVTFNTGSEARYLTATGFDANGRTYANLTIGDGTTPVIVSDSGAGNFQFDNLTVRNTASADSSLSYNTSAGTITIRGSVDSTGAGATGFPDVTLTPGPGGILINGGVTQAFSSANTKPLNFDGNVNIASGTTLNISRILLLGQINPNSKTVTVSNGATFNGGPSGYVVGSLKRTFTGAASKSFEVGTLSGYSPVTMNATSGTFPADFTVSATGTKLPAISGTNALSRYWTLSGAGITADLTFNYPATDVVGTEGNYQFFRYNGGVFTQFAPSAPIDTVNHVATLNGVTSFSDWTLAEPAAVQEGSIQFASANTNDTESNSGSHTVNVAVSRTGGSDGAVSVEYSVTNGTATTADNDYSISPATGTLNWTHGDTANKLITITVNGDTTYEANEIVNLTLSNPLGGATLGAQSTSTLTITNDDAPPATLVVTKLADTDDGLCSPTDCSLREAVAAANFNSDPSTINFDATVFAAPGPYTINLAGALANLSTNMDINGPGANVLSVRRDTGGDYRILTINAGATVNISGLTLTNGQLTGAFGAGINNAGALTLTECSVSGNSASGGVHNFGGGIHNSGTITLTRSTVSANTLSGGTGNRLGAGIQNTGTLIVVNSTISGNSGAGIGGGICNGGEGLTTNSVTVLNSTIAGNSASTGGGIRMMGGTLTLKSTIIGNNSGTDPDISTAAGTVTTQGYNLVENTSGSGLTPAASDITGIDPMLDVLANYGGPTETHRLQANGPAIDKGFAASGVTTDQRGQPRVDDANRPNASGGDGADIGSFEDQSTCAAVTFTPATLPNGQASVAYSQTFTPSGGTGPYAFAVTAGALPSGLSLSSGGTLSGTPTVTGTFNFTVTVTDANGCGSGQAYSLTIDCPTITLSALSNGIQNVPYNQTITPTGGTAPYSFAVTSGALPDGLSLSSTTGVLSGTPTNQGLFNFTVTVTDNLGCTGPHAYAVTISACPASFTVNSTGDTSDAFVGDGACDDGAANCTLRAAIEEANALPGCGAINIGFSIAGTINLGASLPNLNHDVNLNGPGADDLSVRRDTGGDYRIFTIPSGRTINVTGLKITNGQLTGAFGAGINNAGILTLTECSVSGNSASGGVHNFGGGIHNSGTATIIRSEVSDNSLSGGTGNRLGAGIQNTGTLTVVNSTISGNSGAGIGGGICNGGEGLTTNSVTVLNSTIAGNSASTGGGIRMMGGTLTLKSTIIGNNSGTDPDISTAAGTVTTHGHNLVENTSGSGLTPAASDITGIDPMLDALGNYGGPTRTHQLQSTSQAIDAADNCVVNDTCSPTPYGFSLATDQRGTGFSRQVDGNGDAVAVVDIGAFEAPAAPTNPSGVGAANPSTVAQGGNTELTVTVTPGTNPTSTNLMVNGDLTSIGGSATQQFFDDGVSGGDDTAGDNVFTFTATVAMATTPGAKSLPITITDAMARTGNTSINLTVTVASETDVVVSGVNLIITDGNGGTTNDTLTISLNGSNIRVNDPVNTLNCASPAVQFDANTCDVPQSSVTGNIQVNTLGGNDALTLNFAGGNFVPSGGLIYSGGAQSGSPGDSLTVTGGSNNLITHTFANANDGSIQIDTISIQYTGLEPVTDNMAAVNRVFSFTGGAETITLTDAAGANMIIDSTLGESVTFANPTGSLTINAGTGNDIVTIASVDGEGPYNVDLTINGDADSDTVSLNGDITFASGENLIVNAETLNTGAGADLTTSGAGFITATANDVALDATSTLVSASAVTIRPQTATRPINLGTETGGSLSLTDAELDRVTAVTLNIGNVSSGAITISGGIDLTDGPVIGTLNLVTGANVTETFAGTDLTVANLNITAPFGIGTAGGGALDIPSTTLTTVTSQANGHQFINGTGSGTVVTIGSGDLISGAGTITLYNDAGGRFNTVTGGSDILGDVVVASGATLGGTGSVSSGNSTTVESGATVSPGTSPGILNTGLVSMTAGSIFAVEINGTTAGTGHDQLNVTGSVTLGGATLNLSGTHTPAVGDTFTIIANGSTDAVTPAFTMGTGGTDGNGGTLAEGDTITGFLGSSLNATITYVGNGAPGNDVVLTVVAANADLTVTKSAPATVTEGNNFSYTITVSNSSAANTATATGVTVADTLPGGITFVSASAGCTGGATVNCTLPDIAPGGNQVVTIVVTAGAAPATALNTATASATNEPDSPVSSNQTSTTITAAVCTSPPAGMVGWWPGDGNANDIQSPTFENGTLQGGATFDSGKVGPAFKFDGVDDYVSQTLPANVKTSNISIDAWVNLSAINNTGIGQVIVAAQPTGANGIGLGVYLSIGADGRATFTKGSAGPFVNVSGTTVLSTGLWYHVAGTYDGATMRVYVNGVEEGSLADAQPINWTDAGAGNYPDPAQLYFGAYKTNQLGAGATGPDIGFLNGRLDEIEIFTSALAPADITNIYNASFAGKCRECTTPPSNMQAWLPAEGNANDIAGPNNGTFAANTYAPGKVGQAFSLNGTTDYVGMPNLVYGSSFSVDAWIKTSTVPAGLATIVDEIGASTNEGFQCSVSAEPLHVGQVRFYLSDDTNTVTTYSTALVNDGVFHHVACVKNGNTAEVYVDGVLSGTGNVSSVTGIYDAVTGGTSIGAARLGAGQFFQGLIDEVEIFNRALTATEIAAIANAGNAGKCHTSAVTVGVAPASVAEDAAGNLVYTFRRSGDITTAVTVNFSIGGTASFSGNDYTQTGATTYDSPAGQGTIEFLANEGTKTITIDPTPDTTVEPDETVVLTVTSGSGYEVGSPAAATGTISNDDATLTLVKTVTNDNGGNKVVSDFPLFIDGNPVTSGTAMTVSANVQHTASETTQTGYTASVWGGDCLADGTITLQPGDNKTCTITNDDVAPTLTLVKTVINDSGGSKVVSDFPLFIDGNPVTSGTAMTVSANAVHTATETAQTGYAPSAWGGDCNPDGTITLQPGDNKTCTITNDDVAPTISIDNVSHAEGDTSTVDYDFTVSLSYSSTQTITVNYATANDSAVAPGDYTAVTTTQLTFNPGDTSKPVKVVANTDTVYELDEDFVVNLSSPVNATIGDGEGRGTITNDDPRPNLSIGNATKFEGTTPGTVSFDFTVTKSGNATDVNATVTYTTAAGTASENPTAACSGTFDYQFKTGSLTFTPLEFTKTITILVCKDSTFEANETFFVNLTGETNVTVTDNQGLGTIANDDAAPPLSPVNTTNDTNDGTCNATHCSLREAINAANASAGSVSIIFAIPVGDSRHFYYTDDAVAGQVSLANITTTTAADDSGLVNPDPDWPHSWWSILPASALPALNTTAVGATIDGYSQTGASADTASAGHNAILRIEINGSAIPGGVTYGLEIDNGSNTVTGLIINRFLGTGGPGTGNGVGMTDSSDALRGNFIGTDPSGTLDVGNAGSGVVVTVSNVNIGGANVGDANLISGNDGHGIAITGNSIVVQGNYIGTKANGTSALPNTLNGVALNGGGAVFNTIGGTGAGEANLIGFNSQDGVNVSGGFSNIIRANSIFSNGTTTAHLGIDLGTDGVTANDPLDPDSGPNKLQNFPVIRAALVGTPNRTRGTLNSEPNQTYTIDFYATPATTGCDASGNGEGKTYLGSTTAETGANGDALWSFNPTALNAGDFVTATATDSLGNTSEFSACLQVAGSGTVQFVNAPYTDGETNADHTVTITVSRTGGSSPAVDVTYATSDGTATDGEDYVGTSGTLHWNNGETGDKTFTITVKGDTVFEGGETVNIKLSNPVNGATIAGTNPTTLTITNDDPQPALSINDVSMAEGNGGATSFIFTVSKTNHGPVTVNYQTQDGTAQDNNPVSEDNDYQPASGALSWTALDTAPKTITVTVNGDATPELIENFTVVLSGATGATISDDTGLGTIHNDDESVSTGQLIISEFRLSGPGANPAARANNEFIELYNATDQDLLVTTTDGAAGWAVATSSGVAVFHVPNGTIIPAREHFLGTNTSGYSLKDYGGTDAALGNATWTTDVPDNTALAVFRTNNPANFSVPGNRLDSVGPNTETNTLYKEGPGYSPLAPADLAQNLEHTFFRQICVFQAGCPTPGRPRDTQDNAADFIFADTIGTTTSAGRRLGSPGPENLASPIKRDPAVNLVFLDASVSDGTAPNRDRNTTSDSANASLFGTMTIRRRVVNQTGGAVTRLRFRVIEMTTHPSGPLADLRLRSSPDQVISSVNDPNTCASTGTPGTPSCTVNVKGLTLEQPPNVPAVNGGGLNTTLTLPLPGGLPDGQSINVNFLLGVQKTGQFRFYVVIEALP